MKTKSRSLWKVAKRRQIQLGTLGFKKRLKSWVFYCYFFHLFIHVSNLSTGEVLNPEKQTCVEKDLKNKAFHFFVFFSLESASTKPYPPSRLIRISWTPKFDLSSFTVIPQRKTSSNSFKVFPGRIISSNSSPPFRYAVTAAKISFPVKSPVQVTVEPKNSLTTGRE